MDHVSKEDAVCVLKLEKLDLVWVQSEGSRISARVATNLLGKYFEQGATTAVPP